MSSAVDNMCCFSEQMVVWCVAMGGGEFRWVPCEQLLYDKMIHWRVDSLAFDWQVARRTAV